MKRSLALVAALVLAACTSASPTPTPSAPPTSAPSATATPAASPATPSPTAEPTTTPAPIPNVVFEPASVPDVPANTSVAAVVPGGDGLVAIGFDGEFGSTLWTSADGAEWRDITPSGFERVGMAHAVVHDGRIVAVGRGDTTNVEAELAAAYLSEDGFTWTEASGTDLRGQMIDVISTDDGLISVGGVPGADAAGFWRSDTGDEWERIGENVPGAFLWSIVEGGPGYVAVGWRRDPEPSTAVWTSTDGERWELAPDPEGHTGFEATDVVVTESGTLVMVGGDVFGGEGRIWTSPDGLEWTVAEVEGGMVDAGARNVTASPIGLVAVGFVDMNAAAWLSTDDGATWQPFGEPVPDAYFHDAFATDAGLVLMGATQTGTLATGIDARAMIWTAALAEAD